MSKKKDDFGDRMKAYESAFTNQKVEPPNYLCVRLDGRGFSKYTKKYLKPFDERVSNAMIETTKFMVSETHASVGFVQSDEITLIFEPKSQYIFGGKVSKINSVFAAMCSVKFNEVIEKVSPTQPPAYFDCRAWSVETGIEASNVILWRVQDAKRNSVSSLYRWTCGAKSMVGLSQSEMKETLRKNADVDWNDLDNQKKYGTFLKRNAYSFQDEQGEEFIRHRVELVDIGDYGEMKLEDRIEFIKNNGE